MVYFEVDEVDPNSDYQRHKAGMRSLIIIMEDCELKMGYGAKVNDRLLQMEQQMIKIHGQTTYNHHIEFNNQNWLDCQISGREYTENKNPLLKRLKRQKDLKNRTLVNQLREIMTKRNFLNTLITKKMNLISREGWTDLVPFGHKFSIMVRQWMAVEHTMNQVNDSQSSTEGNFLRQFFVITKECLGKNNILENHFIT